VEIAHPGSLRLVRQPQPRMAVALLPVTFSALRAPSSSSAGRLGRYVAVFSFQ
jgi:hypothetical protein